MATLLEESRNWVDTVEYAQGIKDRFDEAVNADIELGEHRDYIEKHGYGWGERCFHWLWRLIVDEMPRVFSFLEIGVYKGQVLSLVRLLANRTGRAAFINGVTPLSKTSGVTGQFPDFDDADFGKCIENLHSCYGLEQPHLIVGDSTDTAIQEKAVERGPYDIVYIDGCHETPYVISDLMHYPPMLKPGGLLVIDDVGRDLRMPKGFFKGIESVCVAVRSLIETNPDYEHVIAVVHNRVWRRT